jgi:putative SOS response-associated peptidase YedK
MCGLYSFRRSPEETRNLFNYLEQPDFPPRQHVAPLSPMAIVRQIRGERHFALVRWGFIPSWVKEVKPGKPLINARSETVLEKPSFRNAMKRRRCLIPADGFYEWQGDVPGKKQPWFIHRPDHGLIAFAGLWEHWLGSDGTELETSCIITTEPNALVATIHDRSPVVIQPRDFDAWLDCDGVEAAKAAALLKPVSDSFWEMEKTVVPRGGAARQPIPPLPASGRQLKLF